MSSIWTLRRSATDSKASGLCGGLAAHWNVDPVLVRIGAVILALSGGIGVVLYAAGWALIPVAGQAKAPIDDLLGEQARKIPREGWVAIVAVLCMIFFAALGALMPFGVGPALILAAVWYFGFYRGREQGAESGSAPLPQPLEHTPEQDTVGNPFAGPATPFTEAARAWQERIAAYERSQSARSGATAEGAPDFPRYPHRAPTPRPDSPLQQPHPQQPHPQAHPQQGPAAQPAGGRGGPLPGGVPAAPPPPEVTYFSVPDPVGIYTEPAPVAVAANQETVNKRCDSLGARRLRLVSLIVLGLAMAGLGLAAWQGANVPLLMWLATALLVVSLTLVAGAFVGRPKGTMLGAILLAVSVACTGLGTMATGPNGPIAPYSVRYVDQAAMPAEEYRDFGQMHVDLSAVDVTEDQTYDVRVDVGSVRLIVPEGENVIVNYEIDLGSYDVLGDARSDGADLHGSTERIVDEGEPTLTLNVRADLGQVVIE